MSGFVRPDGRGPGALRKLVLEPGVLRHAEGSCRVRFGETEVLCAATLTSGVPAWRRGQGKGWLTAEYAMLPRSGLERVPRSHLSSGRTKEIQRTIGRALRSMIDLDALGENTITLDCDVVEADGGTRTAAITGGAVAVRLAVDGLIAREGARRDPVRGLVAAVSVGVVETTPLLDLAYAEDSRADVDMNVVVDETGAFIEVQGTAEGAPFSRKELGTLLALAARGTKKIFGAQRRAIARARADSR